MVKFRELRSPAGKLIINVRLGSLIIERMTDPIADMLTRIRNALMVRQSEVLIPHSNVKMDIAQILKREGFITDVTQIMHAVGKEKNPRPFIKVDLKYKTAQPVIRGLQRVSTPGRRVYYGYREMPKQLPSLGMLIISTPQGMMPHLEARQKKLGGEVMCEIF